MEGIGPNQQAHVGERVAVVVAFADAADFDGERRWGAIGIPTDGIPLGSPDRGESASVDQVQRHVCVFAIGNRRRGGLQT